MAQQVKLPEPNMSLKPRTYMVNGKNKVLKLFSDLHMCTMACTSHMQTYMCAHTYICFI